MHAPHQGGLRPLKGLQNLALARIGTEDRGSIGTRLEHFVVLLLALDVFARVVGAKGPAVGSRPPLDRTTEEFFTADLQQRIRSTGAVFLFPLPVKYGVRGREKNVLGSIAK